MTRAGERGPEFVQALERGLTVIRAFDSERPELSLSEVAAATGLTRAAVRRFLLTLVELGYVRANGRLFSLRPTVLELGYTYLSNLTLPEIAQPHLEHLVAQVRESSSISVLDGDDIVYVARVPTTRIMTISITVGTRFPAYATSMGRVLLSGLSNDELRAFLSQARFESLTSRTVSTLRELEQIIEVTRAQGWAVVDQELEEGLRSVAAPIRDRTGRIVAAINVSSHASRVSLERIRRDVLPSLLATAQRISNDFIATGRRVRV